MSSKKILFTSHTANFQKFNRPFMRMLSEQGYEVHYASMGEEEILDCDKSFVVPFTRSPFGLSNIAAYRQLKTIIDREHYDIIHTHTPMGSVVTRLAARAARKKGTRVIYTAHGFHFFKGAPLLNWLIYYPVERYMARHTDTLITINREDYGCAKKYFKTDVQYTPGIGVDMRRFQPATKAAKSRLRAKHGYDEKDFILIYVAELNANKNQAFLIKQMPKILQMEPNVKLILCGEGGLHYKYDKLVEALNLKNVVYLAGYRNDIDALLQMSDLYVASSIREGLGINLVEAAAAGLPIIATSNRGHDDVANILGNRVKLFDIGDAKRYVDIVTSSASSKRYTKTNLSSEIETAKIFDTSNAIRIMIKVYNIQPSIKNEPSS